MRFSKIIINRIIMTDVFVILQKNKPLNVSILLTLEGYFIFQQSVLINLLVMCMFYETTNTDYFFESI